MIPSLAAMLREAGYDAISAAEAGTLSATDNEQFENARRENRTILTYNYRHFELIAEQASESNRQHAGIIISYHQYTTDQVGALFRAVSAFLDFNDTEYLKNSLRVLPKPDLA